MFKLPDREDGEVLFANRDLEFVFLDPAVWASPLLWTRANGLPSWFWRCDLNFLSWVNGVAAKAGDKLPAAALERVNFVRSCVCAEYGITDDNWEEKMPAPGAKLDTSFFAQSVSLCDRYCGPAWPGIEECAESIGYKKALRLEVFDPPAHREIMRAQEYADAKKRDKSKRK